MAVISFPLGFKIVANTGAANTGSPIDERQVFSSLSARTSYDSSFFYEGLLSYTIGNPYHVSGVTSDAGFYYRNSSNTWVGFNSDTLDDKHAQGTMDSSSNATSNPTTGTNIVDHINYLYTVTSSIGGSRTWKSPVTNFSDLATTYPTPSVGWSALVTSTSVIYTWNGSVWVATGANVPALSSSVDGIVSHTWYNTLNDVITNPTNYSNKNVFGYVIVQNGGSSVIGSPVTAALQQDSFTINTTGGLTASVSGNTITLNSTGGGGSTPISNILKWDTTSSLYRIYLDKTEAGGASSNGKIYGSSTNPSATDRANYDGYFYATKLFSGGNLVEQSLGNPSIDGQFLVSTATGVRSWTNSSVTINDNILKWDASNSYYKPYISQTIGCFDSSSTDPIHSTRLNYDGDFHATYLYGISIFGTYLMAPIYTAGGIGDISMGTRGTTYDLYFYKDIFGTPISLMTLKSTGKIGIGITNPTKDFSFSGDSDKTIWLEDMLTSNTAGSSLIIQAGGVSSDGNNKTGGTLILSSGKSRGNVGSSVSIATSTPGVSGTTLNNPTVKLTIDGNGNTTILGDIKSNVLKSSGSTPTNGYFYSGTTDPTYTDAARINYSGLIYSNRFNTKNSSTLDMGIFSETGINFYYNDVQILALNPNLIDGETPYVLDTTLITHTSGNLLELKNNTVNKFNIDYQGSVNIPTGATYQINGVPIVGSGLPIIGNTQTNSIKLSTSTTHNNLGLVDLYLDTGSTHGLYVGNYGSGNAVCIENTSNYAAIRVDNYSGYTAGAALSINQFVTSSAPAIIISNSSSVIRTTISPTVNDSSSAIGYIFGTNALSTSGAKIASFQNNGVEKAYIDYNGNVLCNKLIAGGSGVPNAGVYGIALAYGVYGTSSNGNGIYGTSTTAAGVAGISSSGPGISTASITGVGLQINNSSGNTSNLIEGYLNSVLKFSVSNTGTTESIHIGGLSSMPSITPGLAMGTSGSGAYSISGTDIAGQITITTANTCTTGQIIRVTFNVAYGTAPYVVFSPANSNASDIIVTPNPAVTSLGTGVGVSIYVNSSTTYFDLIVSTKGNILTDATQYKWNYHVIQ